MSEISDSEKSGSTVDLHRVLLEIEEEVRAKRASGELAPELERELDLVFARFAPPGAVEGDFDALMERAEQQSFIDLLAPNESPRPGVSSIKRIVQKTVRWYLRYVVEQVGAFAHTITRSVRILGERVKGLEQLVTSEDEVMAAIRTAPDSSAAWREQIVEALRGTGRVLHARCGEGALVAVMAGAGIDAYGVDAAADVVATGTANGLDLRPDDEREHLRTLSPGALGGLVLSGCVDFLPRGAEIELLDLAAVTLGKGGALILVVTHPSAWQDALGSVYVDLAPGRPMHTETWRHLLTDRGFTDISVSEGERGAGLHHVEGEGAAELNTNIDRLNAKLFPPTSTLIIARR